MIEVLFHQLLEHSGDFVTLQMNIAIPALPPVGSEIVTDKPSVGVFRSRLSEISFDVLYGGFNLYCSEHKFSDRDDWIERVRFLKSQGWDIDEEHSNTDDPT